MASSSECEILNVTTSSPKTSLSDEHLVVQCSCSIILAMGLQDIAERFQNTSKLWSMYWHRINNKRRKENLANFHWRTAITIDTHAHSAKLCVFTWKWNARVLSHKMQVCGGCSCLVSSIQYRFCGLGENGIGGS
jgi:hypothetical protein